MSVGWGLLSTARINGALLGGIAEVPDAEVVAVASRSEERARAYAREHGIPRAHGSYEALLADPEVDAVYVSVPNSGHVPWAIRALEAGKHVLCEKPLTARADEAAAAFDAAERAGRHLSEAFMWRHLPHTDAVARLVRDGAVGEPRAARAVFSFALDRPDDPRWDLALGGGSIMDVGCYAVSALRLLCGEPGRVSCETVMRGEVDARASAVLRFPGDVLGVAECGFDAAREGIEVTGTAGRIVVETPWFSPRAELVRPDGTREPIEAARVNPYAAEVADLTRAIAGGGTPRLGREDALGQARTIEALYRSAAEGRPVAVGAA